ncbi:MAG: ATP-binding protein [Vulcanimicrobiota bacterium]
MTNESPPTRKLSERVIEAQEGERASLSREIHDGMLQCIIAARMLLDDVIAKVPRDDLVFEDLLSVEECLAQANREGRSLLTELRPADYASQGLVESIACMLDRVQSETDTVFEFAHDDIAEEDLTLLIRSNLFRVVQECVRNVIKHSGSSRAKIDMGRNSDEIWVRVEDWGCGFEVKGNSVISNHIGLSSIRERAELLNGRFSTASELGKGSTIEVRVPIRKGLDTGFHNLRTKAQALLAKRSADPLEEAVAEELSASEIAALLHEFEVRCLELELQNDQLRTVQSELETVRDKYRNLHEYAPSGYLTTDSSGRITSANLTLSSMLKCPRHRLLSATFESLLAHDSKESGLSGQDCEIKMLRPGSPDWFWARLKHRESPGEGFSLAVTDITAERKAEEKRQRLQLQLDISTRRQHYLQETESAFFQLNKLVHEFEREVEQRVLNPEFKSDFVEGLKKVAGSASALKELSIKFSCRPLKLDSFLLEVIPKLTSRLDSTRLAYSLRGKEQSICANPVLLATLVDDLLKNAFQALQSERDRVTVSTGKLNEKTVYLEIADTGVGMDETTRKQMFEPFFTTRKGARGMGLYEVLRIVRGHQGEISVLSELGRGTTVRVVFPLMSAESP